MRRRAARGLLLGPEPRTAGSARRRPRELRRGRRAARGGGARRRPRGNPVPQGRRLPGPGGRRSARDGRHLPDRLPDQGGRERGHHGAAGGGPAPHLGPGRPPPPRIPRDHRRPRPPRRNLRRGARAAAGHHPPPAHPHRGDHLRRGDRRPGMGRGGHHRLVLRAPGGADPRNGATHGVPALRNPPRRSLGLWLRDRHPGGGRRGCLGDGTRRIPPHPHLQAARDGRHPLLPPARQA